MYKIITKRELNPSVILWEVDAPHIAKKAQAGQFVIVRVDENGERVPFTVADTDIKKGTVCIIFQIVGKTTASMAALKEGDFVLDFVGPLGRASHLEGFKKVAVIGGGLGTAIAYPQAKKLHSQGAEVHIIAGFRNKELIILEDELQKVSSKLVIATDDGSNGNKGFVTDMFKALVKQGNEYDLVVAIGPLVMMRAVSNLTRELGIKTIVSMNPVMIDGTGMCGGCRVTVDGKTKFACVDGPEFDGHLVDFDNAMRRSAMFKDKERVSMEQHNCNLLKEAEKNG